MAESTAHSYINRLYDFVLALATSGTTIADYLDLCEQLWSSEQGRPWVVAALMRKSSLADEEPDTACVEFLSKKVHGALNLARTENAPTTHDIGRFLPTIIQLMPGNAWAKPEALWGQLLNSIVDEFGITPPKTLDGGPACVEAKKSGLASLFANTIGSPWNKALNEQLDTWREDPDYMWLVALRDAKAMDAMLGAARRQSSTACLLDQAGLLEHLGEMLPFDRRRFLVLHNITTGENILTDPVVDPSTSTIMWRFKIPIEEGASVRLAAGNRVIGDIALARTPAGHITVQKTGGLCRPLASDPHTVLVPKRAAASGGESNLRLTTRMEGALEAVPDGVILKLVWRSEGDES